MLHMPDVTSLGFGKNANNVILMSLVFVFHLCHVVLMWYDIIGVHITFTPRHHGLLHIGMM